VSEGLASRLEYVQAEMAAGAAMAASAGEGGLLHTLERSKLERWSFLKVDSLLNLL